MSAAAIGLVTVVLVLVLATVKPLGLYIAAVMEGREVWIVRLGAPLERRLYGWCGTDPQQEMSWRGYAQALLAFNTAGVILVYALQRLQGWLPLNPQALGAVSPQSAFNTAVSFATNTDWQGYAGETTMSYLTQMGALTVQNFLSAATGLAVALALIRGFARSGMATIGNFWVDMTRATLYVLLPLALLLALALAAQGVVQNFTPNRTVTTLEPTLYQAPLTVRMRQATR
jgi:K+-transporting ATPase ATPase A chain